MVEEIISGANASIIKIQRPRKFQYSINAVVAAKMQIKLSPQVLKEATEIFN
jgi:ABC-type uncharacterized transport system substrate-binding protein